MYFCKPGVDVFKDSILNDIDTDKGLLCQIFKFVF